MRILFLACLIMGFALIALQKRSEPPSAAVRRPHEISQRLSPTEKRIAPRVDNENVRTSPRIRQRDVAAAPAYTIEPGEFRYDRDPENRDYIEEGVSLEDLEREKNQYE